MTVTRLCFAAFSCHLLRRSLNRITVSGHQRTHGPISPTYNNAADRAAPTGCPPTKPYCSKPNDPKSAPVVYHGLLTKPIHVTKFVSLTSSAFGLCIQPYLISQAAGAHPAVIVAVGSFVCFFTYITPFVIHWLTKRYVVELRFDPTSGTFVCTTINFFLLPKYWTFRASDVVVPSVTGPFTSFLVKGAPFLIDPRQFNDADAYSHLMGYDKPLDLKLGTPSEDKAD